MNKNLSSMHKFFYSRRKLSLYLLFNLGLLALALCFTYVIFPQYEVVYSFAVVVCVLSVISAAAVLFIRYPLAVINPSSIKIDLCSPLKWKDIQSAKKVSVGHCMGQREIIILKVKDLSKHKLNFMQRLIKNSEYSAFSIPLYAMDDNSAAAIEKLINSYVKIMY